MDMHSGTSLWGSIEWGIASSAAIQLARHCGIPNDFMGVGTDSKLLDQQSGIERAMLAVLAFLTGPSLISGGGYIDTISTGSLEQLVIDDEIFSMARRITKGIQVDDEHMALDLIAKVGAGNNFMGEEHTRKYFRQDHFLPTLADRHSYGTWEELGATDMPRRAHDKAEQILSAHKVPTLPEAVCKELDSIINAARREFYS
jgi:trimethylamine--corrinoid protein Co-methyltransferase